jgi:23S rRNA (adenine2503-C2)-methyltransferase
MIDPRGMSCSAFCDELRNASGLEAYYGRLAYRALMLHGSLDAPEAYSGDAERRRVAEKTAPHVGIEWPLTASSYSQGALKFTSKLHDGALIESVALENLLKRPSLCVSTQAGCRLACAFCATGAGGYARDLSAAEIVGQVMSARRDFGKRHDDWKKPESVVLMGMGEPLDNYAASLQALRVLSDQRGLGMPITRMTISSAGIIPGIERLAAEQPPRPKLAISLHAAEDGLRSTLMPINQAYPLKPLKQSLLNYARATGQAIFIEYLLLSGVNDQPVHAKALAAYLSGLPVKVNLLEYNDSGRPDFSPSAHEDSLRFRRLLIESGLFVHPRRSKGSAAGAACGQLGRVPMSQP